MQKLYTKNPYRKPQFIWGILGLLVVGTMLFHPTLSQIKRFQRQQQLSQLLIDVQKPTFEMQEFWQFRDLYSAGNFSFDPQTVSLAGALQFNAISTPSATLLTFKSPLIQSTEAIIETSVSDNYFATILQAAEPNQVLFHLSDRLAYLTPDQRLHLAFLRSTDEMKQTLGLFDYGDTENHVLAHRMWLDETVILQ